MKDVIVLEGQTLADIAVQELGDAERTVELAALNGLVISEELIAGTVIAVPDYDLSKTDIAQLFKNSALAPASAAGVEEINEGIGYWYIQNDFVVQ